MVSCLAEPVPGYQEAHVGAHGGGGAGGVRSELRTQVGRPEICPQIS